MSDERYLHDGELIPGYDYDPVRLTPTLVEVYGVWLNPAHVASVWAEDTYSQSERKQVQRTLIRMVDGQIFHAKESVEQVVAAINGGMR